MQNEEFKEMVDAVPGKSELTVKEMQDIYNAANKDPFRLITYAYAFGFRRGTKVAKRAAKGKHKT